MKENPYFKGRDIRAVENPYEAAFDLAKNVNEFSDGALSKIKILIGIFVYYAIVIIFVIYFNIFFGKILNLVVFSLIFSLVMLIVTILLEKRLITSLRFFMDIRANHHLLVKIDGVGAIDYKDFRVKKGQKFKEDPMTGLLELICATSKQGKTVSKTFRFVVFFIGSWYLAGVLYLSIQFYRFGSDANNWEFDWLLPGGIDLVIAVLATVLIVILNNQFGFVRQRYSSIDHALNSQRVPVPKARTPIDRFVEYLVGVDSYGQLATRTHWTKGKYFDLETETKKGMILLKYSKNTPKLDDLQELSDHVLRHFGDKRLNLVCLIFKESPKDPLSDDAYEFVIWNPIKSKHEICNIQLVLECQDGNYDLIPVISF